jgi:hypothetical protein
VGSVGRGRWSAGVVRGARRRSPLEQAFRRGGCLVDHGSKTASNSWCKEKAVGALAGEIGRSDPRFVVAAPMAGTA